MNFHIGTSGYSYKEWKGSFYPEDLSAKKMLSYYAERFNAVESNGTFYKMPAAAALAAWLPQVPKSFKFILKAPQRITHFQRLKNAEKTLKEFLTAAKALKSQLGPLLFQLPPNMKKDAARLADFLKLIPKKQKVAFEFRHQSWLDEETLDILRKRNAALCIAEAEDGVEVPFISTADWGYVRLRMLEYTDKELKARTKNIQAQKWGDVFIFFKHEDEARGPRMAQRLMELLSQPPPPGPIARR